MLLFCCIACARGDVVVLDNGESLSGTFSRVRENTLVFRTSLQGQMMTPMSRVRSLSVAGNWYVALRDGQVFYGRLGVVDGRQALFPLDGGPAIPLDVSAIQETLLIPASSPGASDNETLALDAGLGARLRMDRSLNMSPTTRLDRSGRLKSWTFTGNAVVERVLRNDIPSAFDADTEWMPDNLGAHPFWAYEIERDTTRSLNLRGQLTLGLYRDLYAGGAGMLLGGAGLALDQERAATQRDNDRYNQLKLRYFGLFAQRRALSESLLFYPAIVHIGELRARSEIVYALPITDQLKLRLDLVMDYESDPVFGGLNRWKGAMGLGIEVAF